MSDAWRLATDVHSRIPTLPMEERARIRTMPETSEIHATLVERLPFLGAVEVGAALDPAPEIPHQLRVVAWNAERCCSVRRAAALLEETRADVFLLSEMDLGMARSEQRHTTRELARALGCEYVFGVEFLELGLGGARERAEHAGKHNAVGYHGGAILSRLPLECPAAVRLETRGEWFDGTRGERRVGGRVTVLARVRVGSSHVSLASVHLESHGEPAGRAEQLRCLIEALDAYNAGASCIIGGDVNSHTLGPEHLSDRRLLGRVLTADPDRLRRPVPYEPLFEVSEKAGYDWRQCNRIEVSTQRIPEPPPSARGSLKLDWFFTRGLLATDPEVIPAIDVETGEALSDHEAIAVTVAPD